MAGPRGIPTCRSTTASGHGVTVSALSDQPPLPSFPPANGRRGLAKLSDATLVSVLLLFAALLYTNTLSNDFLFTCDDGTQILKNPYVHSFRYLREIFSTNVWSYLGERTVTNYYRPVMTLGYLLCYMTFGPSAVGFHLVSVALHTAVVGMVFLVTRQITSDRILALGAAVLFACHPIHTEAVDWISAATELELAFFYLTAFWFFLRVARPGGLSGIAVLAMSLCYILALLSKEQALTLPALAAVYEHFYRPDRQETTFAKKASRYGALWLLGAVDVVFRVQLLGGFAPLLQRPRFSHGDSALAALALFGQYAWKLLWPARLSMYYAFPDDIRALLPWMGIGAGALIICALLFVTLLERDRFASFGLIWLIVTLAPVLNARWMASNVFAERYLYLPSAGFCWLAASLGVAAWRQLPAPQRLWRVAFPAALGLMLMLSVVRISARNMEWRDDVTLLTQTLAAAPDSPVVLNALALAHWTRGDSDTAEREWRRLLARRPNDASGWNYLGVVLAQKRLYAEAMRSFARSLELEPDSPDAHLNLGAACAEQGLMALAETHFLAAAALAPSNVQAHNVLGKLYFDSGRSREAEKQFLESLERDPNVAAYDYLGYIYLGWGERDRAERAFKGALSINASESRAHFSLGEIYSATGRRDEAIREYLAGLMSEPGNAQAQAALQQLRRPDPGLQSPKP